MLHNISTNFHFCSVHNYSRSFQKVWIIYAREAYTCFWGKHHSRLYELYQTFMPGHGCVLSQAPQSPLWIVPDPGMAVCSARHTVASVNCARPGHGCALSQAPQSPLWIVPDPGMAVCSPAGNDNGIFRCYTASLSAICLWDDVKLFSPAAVRDWCLLAIHDRLK